jgi:hypothetical protein
MHEESAVLPAKQSQCDSCRPAAAEQRCITTAELGVALLQHHHPTVWGRWSLTLEPHHRSLRPPILLRTTPASGAGASTCHARMAFTTGQLARHAGGVGLYQSVVVWYRTQGTHSVHHTLLQYSRDGCCCPLSATLLHTGTKLDAVWWFCSQQGCPMRGAAAACPGSAGSQRVRGARHTSMAENS